jgi:hypothetical protein
MKDRCITVRIYIKIAEFSLLDARLVDAKEFFNARSR